MPRKGFLAIGLLMIIQLVAMIMVFITITQFKVSITSIAVDVENINRYQNIPTTIIADTVTMEDSPAASGYMDLRLRVAPSESDNVNCFGGDGPAGSATQGGDSCKKRTTFFFTKFANGLGSGLLSTSPHSVVFEFSKQAPLKEFADNLMMSLPFKCYEVSLLAVDGKADVFSDNTSDDRFGSDCVSREERDVKLKQTYPIPYFLSTEPMVGENSIKIFVQKGGESFMLTWPKYNVKFSLLEDIGSEKPQNDPVNTGTDQELTPSLKCIECTRVTGMGYAIGESPDDDSCAPGKPEGSDDGVHTTVSGDWVWTPDSSVKQSVLGSDGKSLISVMSCDELPERAAASANEEVAGNAK